MAAKCSYHTRLSLCHCAYSFRQCIQNFDRTVEMKCIISVTMAWKHFSRANSWNVQPMRLSPSNDDCVEILIRTKHTELWACCEKWPNCVSCNDCHNFSSNRRHSLESGWFLHMLMNMRCALEVKEANNIRHCHLHCFPFAWNCGKLRNAFSHTFRSIIESIEGCESNALDSTRFGPIRLYVIRNIQMCVAI